MRLSTGFAEHPVVKINNIKNSPPNIEKLNQWLFIQDVHQNNIREEESLVLRGFSVVDGHE
jgi:hypothetical protein